MVTDICFIGESPLQLPPRKKPRLYVVPGVRVMVWEIEPGELTLPERSMKQYPAAGMNAGVQVSTQP
jgi:hypothetical protein